MEQTTLLLIVHVVISMIVSVLGPVQYRDRAITGKIIAYIFSFAMNISGFWPISVGLIVKSWILSH